MIDALDQFKPDALHIATEGPLGNAARHIAKRRGIEFTTYFHTQFPEYIAIHVGRYFENLAEVSKRWASSFICRFHEASSQVFVSTPGVSEMLQSWGLKTPVQVISPGVDTKMFHASEGLLMKNLKRPVALYVGRIAPEKNLPDFLDMEWHGSKVIIGDGPALAELEARYPDCHFLGAKFGDELAEYYRSADVFVFPSRTDTFGMVLIEALACGLPVAAYPVGGPTHIVRHGFLGQLGIDLSKAALACLGRPAEERAKRHAHAAETYSWRQAAELMFLSDNPRAAK